MFNFLYLTELPTSIPHLVVEKVREKKEKQVLKNNKPTSLN